MITTGSMSKAFWAGMRIGWIRANPALVQRLAAARMALDIASPVLEQLVAVELLAEADDDLPAPARGRARTPRRPGRRAALDVPGVALRAARGRPVAVDRARRAAQHGAGRDRRPPRHAARGRPALRRRRRVRALPARAVRAARSRCSRTRSARLARRLALRSSRVRAAGRPAGARARRLTLAANVRERTYVRVCSASWSPPSTASRSSPRNHPPSGSAWRPSWPTVGARRSR